MASTKRSTLKIGGIQVEVQRKKIKNLHLGVYPPNGRVRIAVPLHINDEAARLAVVTKLAWIKRQIRNFENQPRLSPTEAVTGESWYLFGQRLRLSTKIRPGRPTVNKPSKSRLELSMPARCSRKLRLETMDRWYRRQLRDAATPIVEHWQDRLGVSVSFWSVKRMKTRWGSCNPQTRRVWLNSELVKKPIECLEYIIVHELLHLIEPSHGEKFVSLMNKHLPNWEQTRNQLNSAPLAHDEWTY